MKKENSKNKSAAANGIEEIIVPDPQPKIGDTVKYIWPDTAGPKLSYKTHAAKVSVVHDGHDGRLLDLEVDTGDGARTVKKTPWQTAEDECGNTWDWPADPEKKE